MIGLALAPSLLFVWLASVRLEAQGLYYDELHQAPAAFVYLGRPVPFFAPVTLGDAVASFPLAPALKVLPLQNMHYSGAIKSAVYGLYLRLVRPKFTVVSWRLTGIVMVAVGLAMFVFLAHRTVSTAGLSLVAALLLTDITVILATRHDWGPVALALAIRLVLLGVWLRGAAGPRPSLPNSFALGLLVGLAALEKLSSLVLLLPLAVFFSSRGRATLRHLLAVTGGLLVGALPFLVANATSWLTRGHAIALASEAGDVPARNWHEFLRYVPQYLGLGAGEGVRAFILGSPASPWVTALEPWLMVVTLAAAAGGAWRKRSGCAGANMALQVLGAYIAVGVAVYLLPRLTWIHHWVLGTPFQYVAIALALDAMRLPTGGGRDRGRLARYVLFMAVGAVLVTRVAGLASLELALGRGEATSTWHPDLTRVGQFAAKRAGEAAFIAADWGVGTQIFSLAQGRPALVKELFWGYRGPQDLLRFQEEAGVREYYAVSLRPRSGVTPENTTRIFQDLEGSPNWQEMEPERELQDLIAVSVRKFMFVPTPKSPPDASGGPAIAMSRRQASTRRPLPPPRAELMSKRSPPYRDQR